MAPMKLPLPSLAMRTVDGNQSWYCSSHGAQPQSQNPSSLILQAAPCIMAMLPETFCYYSASRSQIRTQSIQPFFKGSLITKMSQFIFQFLNVLVFVKKNTLQQFQRLSYVASLCYSSIIPEIIIKELQGFTNISHIFTDGEVRYTYIFIPIVAFS